MSDLNHPKPPAGPCFRLHYLADCKILKNYFLLDKFLAKKNKLIAKINVLFQKGLMFLTWIWGETKKTAHSTRSKETNLADVGSVEGAVEAWGGGGGIESPPSPSQQFLIIIGIFD